MSADHLPLDVWRAIGLKLDSIADRIRFSAVCKSWASLLSSTKPLWLILSESDADSPSPSPSPPPRRSFVNLGEETIYQFDVPQLHRARCAGSTGTWLIAIHLDKQITLVNPFSRDHQIHLPSLTTFEYSLECGVGDEEELLTPEAYRDGFIWKIVLSSPPRQGGDCIALTLHHYFRLLAFARPGDASWTLVQTPRWPVRATTNIEDVIFYKQQFYAVNAAARLLVCDLGDPPKLSFLTESFLKPSPEKQHYLVEWMGELLVVVKFLDMDYDTVVYNTNRFQLYKFDSINKEFNELKSLGEYSLFLGFNTSVSVLASSYAGLVKRNCIYFTDDYTFGYRGGGVAGGRDMGVFDLDDKTITPHFKGVSTCFYSPPMWVVPS